jgi:hypothetical protein
LILTGYGLYLEPAGILFRFLGLCSGWFNRRFTLRAIELKTKDWPFVFLATQPLELSYPSSPGVTPLAKRDKRL